MKCVNVFFISYVVYIWLIRRCSLGRSEQPLSSRFGQTSKNCEHLSSRFEHQVSLILLQRWKTQSIYGRVDVTPLNLNDQRDQINNQFSHRDTRRVDNVKHQRPSTVMND